jgi:hypothetical protein
MTNKKRLDGRKKAQNAQGIPGQWIGFDILSSLVLFVPFRGKKSFGWPQKSTRCTKEDITMVLD